MHDLLEYLFTLFDSSGVFDEPFAGPTVTEKRSAGFFAAWKTGTRQADDYAAWLEEYEKARRGGAPRQLL